MTSNEIASLRALVEAVRLFHELPGLGPEDRYEHRERVTLDRDEWYAMDELWRLLPAAEAAIAASKAGPCTCNETECPDHEPAFEPQALRDFRAGGCKREPHPVATPVPVEREVCPVSDDALHEWSHDGVDMVLVRAEDGGEQSVVMSYESIAMARVLAWCVRRIEALEGGGE